MEAALPKLVLYFVPMVLSLTVHECAHAWSAHLLGDETARERGRMTLNPLVHIDVFGTLILPALGILTAGYAFFGWAKPTPINPARFRPTVSVKAGIALSAAAGPISNVVLGVLCALGMGLSARAGLLSPVARQLLVASMTVNAGLAVFNLLPVPPLDGSRVLAGFLPYRTWASYARIGAIAPILLMVVISVPAVNVVIFEPARQLLNAFRFLVEACGASV